MCSVMFCSSSSLFFLSLILHCNIVKYLHNIEWNNKIFWIFILILIIYITAPWDVKEFYIRVMDAVPTGTQPSINDKYDVCHHQLNGSTTGVGSFPAKSQHCSNVAIMLWWCQSPSTQWYNNRGRFNPVSRSFWPGKISRNWSGWLGNDLSWSSWPVSQSSRPVSRPQSCIPLVF